MLNSSIRVQDVVALEFIYVAGQFMDHSQAADRTGGPRSVAPRARVAGRSRSTRPPSVATAIVGEVRRRDTEGTSPARPLCVRWIRVGTRAQLREVRRRQLNPGPLRDDAESVDRSLPESIRDWVRNDRTGSAATHNMRTRHRRATAHRRRYVPLDDAGASAGISTSTSRTAP
jgi:hypothetical protein